jgi:anaerobic selenocysteine-containing dehydrogenase
MNEMSLSRRKFLKGTAGTMALAAAGMPMLGAQQAFAADLASQ